ncbi:TetR/AcrR family transcriptional regulator [Catellatospora sp. KI3]|uniref:TetR/AcrR family transcriptional regulator n=1 Tax=Catellatospora sp. KI3 TaxID=3041620 RepID=UPI0024827A3C|nr:TetR/AcrR family transcriptional regulator [Catellatospora sp. KI3]MDI1462956.1 TetR/AcrR family transcriptional regulator [Catellatospora sp. KI3]
MRAIAYHHGDLRRTILSAAVDAITESGVDGWSLRELARRAGVSHAAPAHHFGDRTGLLTAVAAEGYQLLADALQAAEPGFLEAGLAYIGFATEHPAHFTVMFQPALYRPDDDAVTDARERAGALLRAGAQAVAGERSDAESTALAGWSIAHGFASLWLARALPAHTRADAVAAARPVLRRLVEH